MAGLAMIPAVLLAAGKGRRLGRLAGQTPKPMLKVDGLPVLEHNLKWLRSCGIRKIFINLHQYPQVIRDYFGDGQAWDVEITYSYEAEPLGTAGGVRRIADEHLPGWETLLVVYGDNYFVSGFDLEELLERHQGSQARMTLGLYWNSSEVSKSGVAEIDEEGWITRFVEKPTVQQAHELSKRFQQRRAFINAGLCLMERDVVDLIPGQAADFGKEVIPELLSRPRWVLGVPFDGEIKAIDTPELYKRNCQK